MQQQEQPETQGGEEPVQGKKQKKQPPAAGCDPATGEGCAQ